MIESRISAERSRFAPSTTGPAHPGTLLAALLCWLDARSRGAGLLLRLEDLDPQRSSPAHADAMADDLRWLGLDWDEIALQSDAVSAHESALEALAAQGRLYPCHCSRSRIRDHWRRAAEGGSLQRAPDGGWRYPNLCRGRPLPAASLGGWRAAAEPLRVQLPAGVVAPADESGLDLAQDPAALLGDPVVVRRDGSVAYQLASVVDDFASEVTRVVRGRDLAVTTATQVALQQLLGYPTPVYRHHALLLERKGGKLAKLHGAVGTPELRAVYEPAALCGVLAHAAGLRDRPEPVTPRELLADFSWQRVTRDDRVMLWAGSELHVGDVG